VILKSNIITIISRLRNNLQNHRQLRILTNL
jgi:hypothetical protein